MGTEGDDEDRETEIEDHPGPKGTANWRFDQDEREREASRSSSLPEISGGPLILVPDLPGKVVHCVKVRHCLCILVTGTI